MSNLGAWFGSDFASPRRGLAVAGVTVLLGLAAVGCGDSEGASRGRERVDGVTFFTFELKPGSPIAGPVIMHGSFAIEDDCVVLHSGDLVANPVFIPDGRLSTDHSSMTVGSSTFALDGTTAATFDAEILDAEQARHLGYDAEGDCVTNRFVFVYGDDV